MPNAIVGPKDKENNKLRFEDQPVHNWYRFVLSYPPHLVRTYLDRFGISPEQKVLDPFCGTGTTLVECKKLGIQSVGVEANPIAAFASKVKTDWDVDPAGLLSHAKQVADITSEILITEGISGIEDLPLFRPIIEPKYRLKTISDETLKLLLRESISPLPLHKTLTLLETLESSHNEKFVQYERLALAKAIVFGISNLEFGPEVGVGPAKKDAAVVNIWLDAVRTMAEDLHEFQTRTEIKASVIQGDSRQIHTLLEPHSVDAVITSPPYPNEKDYTRTTRLESILLGLVTSKSDLRQLKQNLLRSNTRGVYKNDNDDLYVADHPEICRIADSIEKRRIELGKTSGFERLYARVTKLYFGGIAQHLSSLRDVLRPGAQLAYVVGDQASYLRVMIRTGQLIADIANSLGYEVTGIDLFRTRLSTATKAQLREEVVLLKWPGKREG